jgi:hypothetical protein
MAKPRVQMALEPPIPTATEYTTISSVRSVITDLDSGSFRRPAIMAERMLWNPRLRAAIDTRLAGHIATQIRWEPVRENSAGRRAARDMREDWPFMAPSPQRKQQAKWGLLLGLALAQRQPFDSPTSGRRLFRMRPYWPGWSYWQWYQDVYKIQVRGGGLVDVPSPSDTLGTTAGAWIVHEPFGEHSWREGLMHALWRIWWGHDLAFRDMNRASEKYGIGSIKMKYPSGREADADKLRTGVRGAGSEAVVPLPQYPDQGEHAGFDLTPLEFSGGAGFEIIERTLNAAAISMAIVLLGHNLTTEVKGGSYAAADIGNDIRIDKKVDDTDAEWATLRPQLAQPWALENYGDPEVAPRAIHVTDPPAVNKAMADTYAQLGIAIRELSILTGVDTDALCERFQLPMKPPGKEQVQVPAPVTSAAVTTPADPNEEAAPTTAPTGGGEPVGATAEATLAITATDLASIVKVNEGRKSVGLPPIDAATGEKWIREHAAKLAAALPAAPGAPAPNPGAEPPIEEESTP